MATRVVTDNRKIHGIVSAIPIALLTVAILSDAVWMLGGRSQVALDVSFWTSVIGVVTSLVSSVIGIIDLDRIASPAVRRLGLVHLLFSAGVILFYGIGAILLLPYETNGNVSVPFMFQLAGFVCLGFSLLVGFRMMREYRQSLIVDQEETRRLTPAA